MVEDASHRVGGWRGTEAGRAWPGCLTAAAVRHECVLRVLDDTLRTR